MGIGQVWALTTTSYKLLISNLYAKVWQYGLHFAPRPYKIFIPHLYIMNKCGNVMLCSLHQGLTISLIKHVCGLQFASLPNKIFIYLTHVNNCGNMFCSLHQCLTNSLYEKLLQYDIGVQFASRSYKARSTLYLTCMHTCGNMVCSLPQPPCMFAHRETPIAHGGCTAAVLYKINIPTTITD